MTTSPLTSDQPDGPPMNSGARRVPTHRIAHLSDTHITGDGSLVGGVVDARAQLDRALGVLTSWNVPCDAWVISGDLSDDGSPESYAWLRDRVHAAAARVGVDVVWATGNHDERAAFRGAMSDAPATDQPYNAEHVVNGLRVLVLDTNVVGTPAGTVAHESLHWLAGRLEKRSEHGTILVMHHSPLPPLQDAAWSWPLTNPGDVAPLVQGSDVRAILSGHFHHSAYGVFAGVGACIAPSLVYTQDVTLGRDLRGQHANQGFAVVEVYDDVVTHTIVPLNVGPGVHDHLRAAD